MVMAKSIVRLLLVFLFLLHGHGLSFADDTCVFAVTANDVPPNIVLLLDNGAEMEQIIWHSAYDNSVNYAVAGSVFTNSRGYAVAKQGSTYYLHPIQADLTPTATGQIAAPGNNDPTWVINSRTITLPSAPSASVDGSGIKDNAGSFRYSTNYLNWLFYSTGAGSYPDVSAVDNGADLPAKTRFYYAKQAIFTMAKQTANKARIGINSFTSNASGSSNVQPLGMVVNTPLAALPENNVLDPNFVNTINNMGTVTYSPLAEGLADVGTYYNSSSSRLDGVYCEKNFVIVVSPGVSSEDLTPNNQAVPSTFIDHDGDNAADGVGEGNIKKDLVTSAIPKNVNGSTWLDDVAYYLATHDVVGYRTGYQPVNTYTVGFMSEYEATRQFLINTSNNGNENLNLYDSTDPEYGKYHFEASSPAGLAEALMDALSSILEKTNAFAAPVVPVTRTTSGNRLYMAFFTPSASSNFWEGNVVKFGIDSSQNIVDQNNNPATYDNGAIREDAVPYWETIDWATVGKTNYISNSGRNIYTYLGTNTDLTALANHFKDNNAGLTAAVLGNPVLPRTPAQIINYVRGADVFDDDEDTDLTENRLLITGDILHSEPTVFQYLNSSGTLTVDVTSGSFQADELIRGSKGGFATVDPVGTGGGSVAYHTLKSPFTAGEVLTGLSSGAKATVSSTFDTTMIFFGSNDGMLHAVNDTYGTEAWAFIPPNQLSRLRLMIDGTGHQDYVDGSPKIYLYDVDGNGFIDLADGDKVILVCGERKGSNGYFALDVTSPEAPVFLWRINQTADLAYAAPNVVIPELGESWSDPRFGKVKTTDLASDAGTPVVFVGGGYSATNTAGKTVLALDVLTGQVVKKFTNDTDGNALTGTNISGMDYSIPSTLRVLDSDRNGFVDKLYVGDAGGQLWRIGRFTESDGTTALVYPNADENINNWRGQRLFSAGCNETSCIDNVDNNGNGLFDERRRFFYTPTVTTEIGYDLVFVSSGDRENPCHGGTSDAMYAVKDNHSLLPTSSPPPAALVQTDLINAITTNPNLVGTDKGWYLPLASGEKVLAENTVFAGTLSFTTFTPGSEPCVPGGLARLYEVQYKTGAAVVDFDGDGTADRSLVIGGGIPSRPVVVIGDEGQGMFVSVGTTVVDDTSESVGAGSVKPPLPGFIFNLRRIWWKEK
jgi:type IV pilus assembly protein PilY1